MRVPYTPSIIQKPLLALPLGHSETRQAFSQPLDMWFLGYLCSVLIALYLVRFYAEQNTNLGIMFVVALSWGLGFSYFLVLPFDIGNAFCRACERAAHEQSGHCSCLPLPGIEILSNLVPACYMYAPSHISHSCAHCTFKQVHLKPHELAGSPFFLAMS